MSRSQSLLLRRHVKRRDTETRRVSAHAGPTAHTARARACISTNAARERSRVRTLRSAFLKLQLSLPSVPPDTKLSKLDVLLLATDYIQHLTRSLDCRPQSTAHGAGHSAGTITGQTSGHFSEQTNTCQQVRGDRTHMQSWEIGRLPRADGRTQGNSRDATIEEKGWRRGEDRMPRQERHPVKKWPMRSRLYKCNLLDVPPLRTGSNDNYLVKKTSPKEV